MEKLKKITVNANLREREAKENKIYQTDIRWQEDGKQIIKRYSTHLFVYDKNGKEDKNNLLKAYKLLAREKRKWEKYLREQQKSGISLRKQEKKQKNFEYLTKKFLKIKKQKQRKETYEKYEKTFKNKILPVFKDIELSKLKAEYFDDFLLNLKENKKSSSTIHHYYIYLKDILTFGYNREYIKKNIAKLIIEPPKVKSKKKNIFTRQQLTRFINSINDYTWKLIIFLSGFYGLRRSEIVGLRWQDINWEKRELTIQNTGILAIIDGKETLVFQKNTKSESSTRTLPISDRLIELLEKQRELQKDRKDLFGDSELVISNETNNPFRPDYISKKLKKFLLKYNESNSMKKNFEKEIKLPIIRFHDLRHTCATLLYEAGVDIKTIQYWLGHSSIRVTLDIYTEFSQAKLNTTSCIIDFLFNSEVNIIDKISEEK